jgi:hypothetical protein
LCVFFPLRCNQITHVWVQLFDAIAKGERIHVLWNPLLG